MNEDDNKRVLDGPITTSMRSDRPSPESIQALRERYARFDKMTAKKPAVPFATVMAIAGQSGREAGSENSEASQSPASGTSSSAQAATPTGTDRFERAAQSELGRRPPLPTARHPDSPLPKRRGKVIIKV